MWYLEFDADGKGYSVGKYAHKHNIKLLLYLVSSVKTEEGFLVNYVMFINWPSLPEDVKKFIEDLKKHETVRFIELQNNRIVCQLVQHERYRAFYNPNLIFLDPIEVNLDSNGTEKVRAYAWKKEALVEFWKTLTLDTASNLHKIQQVSKNDFFIIKSQPKLTDKQRKAITLAMKNNYYDVPRKIKIEKLAELMGTSYSTFQVHLRKAEKAFFSAWYKA